jgi:hypothetical protein
MKSVKQILFFGTLAVAVMAVAHFSRAQQTQTTGTPGSPGATTTIDGKQLPPPDLKFGGVIKNDALQSNTIGSHDGLSMALNNGIIPRASFWGRCIEHKCFCSQSVEPPVLSFTGRGHESRIWPQSPIARSQQMQRNCAYENK